MVMAFSNSTMEIVIRVIFNKENTMVMEFMRAEIKEYIRVSF